VFQNPLIVSTAIFLVITQWAVAISYRRFGTTYRSHCNERGGLSLRCHRCSDYGVVTHRCHYFVVPLGDSTSISMLSYAQRHYDINF